MSSTGPILPITKMDSTIRPNSFLSQMTFAQCNESQRKTAINYDFLLFYLNLTIGLVRSCLELVEDYFLHFVVAVILMLILFIIYKSYLTTDLYKKEFTQIGFGHISGGDRNLKIAKAQAARKLDPNTPPPYPNGWFALAEAKDLKIGSVISVDALGQNFCVYRGEDGVARCVDAFCPHLGANIGVTGRVSGSCIECPFHHWRFAADGALVKIKGLDSVPKGVSLKTWHTVEAEAAIWVWYDAEGREPLWSMIEPEELKSWPYRCRNEYIVSCHIQDIPENAADAPHLNVVHAPSVVSSLGEKFPSLYDYIGAHYWTADWRRTDENHVAFMSLVHDYKVMKMNLFHIDIKISQIGPGHVHLRVSSAFGTVLMSMSVTPLGPLQQKVVHRLFSSAASAPFSFILNRGESFMFERDMIIWNNKRFVSSPIYTRNDKTIRAFRAWYSQFFSEHSVSFREAIQNPLDW